MTTVFLRVLVAEEKATALLSAIREPERAIGRHRFDVDPSDFRSVPRSPFAYWITPRLRSIFSECSPLEGHFGMAKGGAKTYDDFRFVRIWWETEPRETQDERWTNLNKGGGSGKYFFPFYLLINWHDNAHELRAFYEIHTSDKNWGGFGRNEQFYCRPGITWPLRTQKGLTLRVAPAGFIFSNKGPTIFVEGNSAERLLPLLALTNSHVFRALVGLQMAFGAYEVGVIQRTPVADLSRSEAVSVTLARLARRAWSLRRSLDTRTETSRSFMLPALLLVAGETLAVRGAAYAERVRGIEAELATIDAEIDVCCFDLYRIDKADRHTITEGLVTDTHASIDSHEADVDPDGEPDDEDDAETGSHATDLAIDIVSWAVGVTFGRFDLRLATSARPMPTEPEPFDPLPTCSPGMLTGGDGLPLARPPAGYPLSFPETGVLVDDLGHPQDLTTALRAVFDAVFGADADRWWNDVAALLDPKGHELRTWLAGSFFEHHIKRYSKSRRKAPILWQLGTPSGRYSLWLYAHRLSRDSFFQLQNEVVGPKLAHEERQLTSMIDNAGGSPSSAARKQIAEQEFLVEELRAMLDEVKRIAPLWNPNLDDGVVLTMAPLWRLVPQHKSWQKELKAKWDALAAGQYDWAHIAMHLWPERVVPKCASDRSVAIAHGLENQFWVTDFDGTWQPRRPQADVPSHVISSLHDPWLTSSLQEVRTFWNAHYARTIGSELNWWQELEDGEHDTQPLAYALWPDRIARKAATDRALAEAHNLLALYDAQQRTLGGTTSTGRKRDAAPSPRLSAASLNVLRTFCSMPGDAATWAVRWAAFDAGEFDATSELALRVRTEQVVKLGAENVLVAERHGFERWFWLHDGGETRRLGEPEEELRRAVEVRTSPAVKAALKSLLEAPVTGGASKKSRKGKANA